MQILLKGCTSDVIDEISEKIGSRSILNCECTDVFDEPIYQIELNSSICLLHVYPEWINIFRIDSDLLNSITIADFRFEEVIIK